MSNYRSASVKSPIIISIKHLSLILQMYSGSLMFMLTLVYGWSGCVTSGECSMHRQLLKTHTISQGHRVCYCSVVLVLFCTITCHSEMKTWVFVWSTARKGK